MSNYLITIQSLTFLLFTKNRTCCKNLSLLISDHNLLNPRQSAFWRHHSTETSILCIHLINAIGSQKLSCLCLLDLSAAFDTIDHDILLTRL